jgi:hypothetical protein
MHRKYIVALTLTLFFNYLLRVSLLHAQGRDNINDYSKYSYELVGIKNKIPVTLGTGFFFRYFDKLYLVSTNHIFTSNDVFHKTKLPDKYDSLYVRIYDKFKKSFGYIEINVSKIQQDSSFYFYQHPDMYVYQVTNLNPADSRIFSLEKIIISYAVRDRSPDSIFSFGYGIRPHKYENVNALSFLLFIGHLADDFHKDPYYPLWDSLNMVVQPYAHLGMSGSPVFFEYLHYYGNKQPLITFGGMIFGSDRFYRSTFIIRPETVRSEIIRAIFEPNTANPR